MRTGYWSYIRLALFLVLFLLLSGGLGQGQAQSESIVLLAAITVNSAGDQGDAYLADGICDTTGNPTTIPATPYSDLCTLRAALQTAGASAPADTISFSGPMDIQPATQLPAIDYPVTIDGNGQVTLDGSLLTTGTPAGLAVYGGGGSTIQGLTIRKFKGWGVSLSDGVGGNTVQDNVVRENGMGIYIGSSTPNNTIARNLIVLSSGNTGSGLTISSNGNAVKGNKIGTDGTLDLGNAGDGVKIYGSSNAIGAATGISAGGSCTGDCNLIAGNGGDGIDIGQGTDITTGSSNIVRGNFIGTNLAGTAAMPNDGSGVKTNGDENAIVGNLISGNGATGSATGHGVSLIAGALENAVRGNLIGTAIDGQTALGNVGAGVDINYANLNTVGADTPGAIPSSCSGDCNVILGNSAGISITQAVSSGGNKVIGNYIGARASGTSAPGNRGNGIAINGLTTTVASNLIAGNLGHGIEVQGVAVSGLTPVNGHIIRSNRIGVGLDGVADLGNRGHGIWINWSADNWIGGEGEGQGNFIAYNGWGNNGAGVVISDTVMVVKATGNRILRNSIYANGGTNGLGIDLKENGVTANDAGDGDGGPNRLQNFPLITGRLGSVISGTLNSTAGTAFRLEFFSSPQCSGSGNGQGKTFLGSLDATTDGSGNATFLGSLTTPPGGEDVTATATDPNGNTSEFSPCFGGLVVNSTGDDSDKLVGDGICDTGRTIGNGEPECTLRAAMEEANAIPGSNTITFGIPGWPGAPVIFPNKSLPGLYQPVVIKGTTQAGGWVQLDGGYAGDGVDGLWIGAGSSEVRGLVIVNFRGNGIMLQSAGGNVIAGNLIGINTFGGYGGNGGSGIYILSSSDNTIGGTKDADRNVIAFNGWNTNGSGIHVWLYSSGNVIQGNYIGTNSSGDQTSGNTLAGVYIEGASGSTVGGTTGVSASECSGSCNLISGNWSGVVVKGSTAVTNTVQGNFIGTNRTGTAALGNTSYGVVVDGAPDNLIGGSVSAARNLISGNGTPGAGGEGDGVVIGNATATGNQVLGNYIGTKANGAEALRNVGSGVRIEQAPNNAVGGHSGSNVVSGNLRNGVVISGTLATGNKVQANYIGTNSAASAALPNGSAGVLISRAANNTVGGAGLGNVVSGNTGNGVEIAGSGATGNIAQANKVGTNGSGTASLPNGGAGVFVNGAPANRIGGAGAGQGNLLSGNSGNGLHIANEGADGNLVFGNLVGTNGAADAALPNAGDGILLGAQAGETQIGGANPGEGNIIAGNGSDGVAIDGIGAINNVLRGNRIGVLADGTALANNAHGVLIGGGASSNTVGGPGAGAGNTIAFNSGDGIYVASGVSNRVQANSVYNNGGLGIDLGTNGLTPNDAGDGDSGANGLQNFPVIRSVAITAGTAAISGTLNSAPTATYKVELFANTACGLFGHGQGRTYLGSVDVTTDIGGDRTFTFTSPLTVAGDARFTATATDASGNTSEYSLCAWSGVPEATTVDPAAGGTYTFTAGSPLIVQIAPGAVSQPGAITLAYTPVGSFTTSGGARAGRAFGLSAFLGDTPLVGITFSPPITVTLHYTDADVAGIDENELMLRYWNGTEWVSDGVTVVERRPEANEAVFTVAHLSEFALFEGPGIRRVYLPVVLRGYSGQSGW